MKNKFIVLAAHGAPPRDFPRDRLGEFFSLYSAIEAGRTLQGEQRDRYNLLEKEIRTWPRNKDNDPFHSASIELASHLEKHAGCRVEVGFNEFCAPGVDQAIEEAVKKGADTVVIVTPMLTRGGEHAEVEIALIAKEMSRKYPSVEIVYAWPYDVDTVARFLASQVENYL